jgi:hypothetical protein
MPEPFQFMPVGPAAGQNVTLRAALAVVVDVLVGLPVMAI